MLSCFVSFLSAAIRLRLPFAIAPVTIYVVVNSLIFRHVICRAVRFGFVSVYVISPVNSFMELKSKLILGMYSWRSALFSRIKYRRKSCNLSYGQNVSLNDFEYSLHVFLR